MEKYNIVDLKFLKIFEELVDKLKKLDTIIVFNENIFNETEWHILQFKVSAVTYIDIIRLFENFITKIKKINQYTLFDEDELIILSSCSFILENTHEIYKQELQHMCDMTNYIKLLNDNKNEYYSSKLNFNINITHNKLYITCSNEIIKLLFNENYVKEHNGNSIYYQFVEIIDCRNYIKKCKFLLHRNKYFEYNTFATKILYNQMFEKKNDMDKNYHYFCVYNSYINNDLIVDMFIKRNIMIIFYYNKIKK
jgi:hypothetical protein